jgi:hypothetical protein
VRIGAHFEAFTRLARAVICLRRTIRGSVGIDAGAGFRCGSLRVFRWYATRSLTTVFVAFAGLLSRCPAWWRWPEAPPNGWVDWSI